jgi:hypothetical protein
LNLDGHGVFARSPDGNLTFPPTRSSCRACEAAFGCAAVVKSELAVHQTDRISRIHDCFAAERSLAGSTAATGVNTLPMLKNVILKKDFT